MEVKEIMDKQSWNKLWKEAIGGRVYSSTIWLEAVSDAYGLELKILGVFNGAELVGGLPLFIKKKQIIIPPFTPYNSVILKLSETKYPYKKIYRIHSIMLNLIEYLEKQGKYSQITFIHTPDIRDIRPFIWKGWRVSPLYTYVLSISNVDDLKKKISHNARKNLKRCKKEKIYIEESEKFDILFNLLKLTFSRRKRLAPLNYKKLRKIYETLSKRRNAKLFIAFTKEGVPISARIITLDDDFPIAHDWVAGSDPKYFSTGGTTCLLWYIIEWLSSRGFKFLDLNGANIPSIAKFKSNFGGNLEVYFMTEFYRDTFVELKEWVKEKVKIFIKREVWRELK